MDSSSSKGQESNNVPTQVDDELKDFKIFNEGDTPVAFKTLYEQKRAIILFIRHFNWFVCRDFVNVLGQQMNFDELKNNNINLFVVGCAQKKGIKSFAKDVKFPIQYLYTDPDRFTYNKLGMIRAHNFKEIKGDGKSSEDTTSSIVGGMGWSIWKAVTRGNQGDIYQLGGCFVIDESGKILYNFIDQSSQSHITVQSIKGLVQTYGTKPVNNN